jgi:hypothetical protein
MAVTYRISHSLLDCSIKQQRLNPAHGPDWAGWQFAGTLCLPEACRGTQHAAYLKPRTWQLQSRLPSSRWRCQHHAALPPQWTAGIKQQQADIGSRPGASRFASTSTPSLTHSYLLMGCCLQCWKSSSYGCVQMGLCCTACSWQHGWKR